MNAGYLLAGKYRIERVLGQGGMGRVVAAVHEQLGQRVAIKFLLPDALRHDEIVQRFLREGRAAVRLKSEHVGRVIDVGTLPDGAPYIVMEHLDGNDLGAEVARSHRLPVATAVDYVLQACEALAEAHRHGIVHRDIKPANLFLTRRADGSALIKVLDFGISKAAPADRELHLTRTRVVMGSPGYMSPEQARSLRDVDARTDIWSLGIVLYELVSGRPPFAGESLSEVCVKVAMDPTPPLMAANLPPGFEAVVGRCLHKNPADRYANVAELAASLAPYAPLHAQRIAASVARVLDVPAPHPAAMPTVATHPTTLGGAAGQPTQSPIRRRPVFAALAAFALAVGIGAGIAVIGGKPQSPAPTAQAATLPASQPGGQPVTSHTSATDAGVAPPIADGSTNPVAVVEHDAGAPTPATGSSTSSIPSPDARPRAARQKKRPAKTPPSTRPTRDRETPVETDDPYMRR